MVSQRDVGMRNEPIPDLLQERSVDGGNGSRTFGDNIAFSRGITIFRLRTIIVLDFGDEI